LGAKWEVPERKNPSTLKPNVNTKRPLETPKKSRGGEVNEREVDRGRGRAKLLCLIPARPKSTGLKKGRGIA